MSRTAIVAGAGIAGLASAIALRDAGYAVTVVEDAAELAPIGAAISLWGNAVAALDRLGAGEAIRAEAAPITSLGVSDRAGRPLLAPVAVPVGEAFLPSRALVQRALFDRLGDIDLRLGRRVAAIAQDAQGVTVTTGDATVLRADLAVVADGIWSPTATGITGAAPRHAGYGGVLALSDAVPRSDPPGAAREFWGDRERFGLFDLGAERRYWFWMRDETPDEASAVVTRAMARAAAQGWPADIAATIDATPADRLIRFVIHARPAPRRLGLDRIVCVGDAAHAMEPNLGQGACQGIEDAVVLSEMARTLAAADIVAAFTRARLKRVRAVMKSSHGAGRAVHTTSGIERSLTRGAIRLVPPALSRRVVRRFHTLPA